MGVCTGFLTLFIPIAVLAILPPSPIYPGTGPLPNAPPVVIPVDNQRCIAMRREVRRIKVPVPFFCHPRDPKGIPFPDVLDQEVSRMVMRLQWSGYKVCMRQIPMPTHRYIPVPVCCPGWQRGPTGKCDTPMIKPLAISGPCLNGGMLKKNGKCCACPPGFTGAFCQHTAPPSKLGAPFPAPRKLTRPPGGARIRRPISMLSAPIRSRIAQLLRSGYGPKGSLRLPITPNVMTVLTNKKTPRRRPTPINVLLTKKRPQIPLNTAYINRLPRRPTKPVVSPRIMNKRLPLGAINTAYINQAVPRPRPSILRKVPVNVAYINRLPPRQPVRSSVNTAYINPLVNPRPVRITLNTAHINRVPQSDPRNSRPVNQIPVRRPPVQTAYINRLLPPLNLRRIPPNSPRPVMAPPVARIPTLGINPAGVNPVPPPVKPLPVNVAPMPVPQARPQPPPMAPRPGPGPMMPPQPQGRPAQNRPVVANEGACQQILEVGVTRCFRDAGIMAAPRDVFNPQNPEIARSICSQGGRLRPCIMAGETACGRGMRVIITRRMLASLLNAMGNLCSLRPMMPPMRRMCLNGGMPVQKDGTQSCDCPQGFGGQLCELPACMPACMNNGMCENVDGSPKCVCQNGFYGDQCENVVAVTTVTDPKPVDPPTHSLETSPNPVPVPVKSSKPEPKKAKHAPISKKKVEGTNSAVAQMEIFGYPLWFVLSIVLGFFVFLLVIFVTCCLCLKCRRSKRSFEVTKEAVKLPIPILDNIYTVGVVPPVYEAKGIPPLSYEEAKGETIRGLAKQLENNEDDDEDTKEEEEK